VPVKTIRNWEQRIRNPTGPAKALLLVAMNNPIAVRSALEKTA
jgi:DNA-binding transcriptional regulator YiaG